MIYGEWNMSPAQLIDSGWVHRIGADIGATRNITCSSGSGSELDYFVVSRFLRPALSSPHEIEGLPWGPHHLYADMYADLDLEAMV